MARNPKPGTAIGEAVKGVLFAAVAVAGLLVWSGGVHLGDWRMLLARLVDDLAPWLIAAVLIAVTLAMLVLVRRRRRGGQGSWVRRCWRGWWHYRRRWARMMILHSLVTLHDERTLIPRLRRVIVGDGADTLHVVMVPGQAPEDWRTRADALAHAFGAHVARVRVERPALLGIDLRYGDSLAEPIPLADRRRDWRDAA